MLALVAKFDFKTLQLDIVNVFMYANLNKMVFIRMPPRYSKQSKLFKLNKMLYNLHWSFLLWQQKLTKKMKKFGFKEIPQEPCIIQKNDVICFFYVNNIVFIFKKDQRKKIKQIVDLLLKTLTIERKRKLKWFLRLYMIRNCSKKAL